MLACLFSSPKACAASHEDRAVLEARVTSLEERTFIPFPGEVAAKVLLHVHVDLGEWIGPGRKLNLFFPKSNLPSTCLCHSSFIPPYPFCFYPNCPIFPTALSPSVDPSLFFWIRAFSGRLWPPSALQQCTTPSY